jgi:hypothetical protein
MTNASMDMLLSQDYPMTGGSPLSTPNSLYGLARKRARRGQFWSKLTGRSRGLFALKQVRAVCTIKAESDGGIRTVPFSQIRGSEGRAGDFDRDFDPLKDHTWERWLGIAAARESGTALPPVSLVQVGDIYFVKDGHHRISVARALGQSDIDARVTIWQATGPVPWETLAQAPGSGLIGQLLGTGRAFKKRGFQGLSSSARSACGSVTGG